LWDIKVGEPFTLSYKYAAPVGLRGDYPGYYNTQISPIYQSIRMFDTRGVSLSALDEIQIEPIIYHFEALRQAFTTNTLVA